MKRVAKRLFDPARLTVVIGGSPMEARARRKPVPLPPGNAAAAATAGRHHGPGPGCYGPGVLPAQKPANKPLTVR